MRTYNCRECGDPTAGNAHIQLGTMGARSAKGGGSICIPCADRLVKEWWPESVAVPSDFVLTYWSRKLPERSDVQARARAAEAENESLRAQIREIKAALRKQGIRVDDR